jgi:phosphatidylinositol alpha-mannosyltransferase
LRLLFSVPDFWPHVRRGSERLVHDLATVMAGRGHEVLVVTRTPESRGSVVRDGAFTVHYHPAREGLMQRARLQPLEKFGLTAMAAALRHDADLYHAFYLSDAWGFALATALRRRPFVLSVHGQPGRDHWTRWHHRTHRMFLYAIPRARGIGVLSQASARRMRDDYGFLPTVLTPGIFAEDFALERSDGDARTIVCSAAVDDVRKRIDLLLDAFELVAHDEPDVQLLLVGPGDPAPVQRRRSLMPPGVARRVAHRAVATAELPGIYAGCTVGVLCSEREAFGLVLAEYLAAGMPVVGTDDGGIPEVVTPDTGALFAAGDATACAAALRRALQLASRPAVVARCRARARDFDWSVRAADYERFYLAALR